VSESKFTPGPWIVARTPSGIPKWAEGDFVGKDGLDGFAILIVPTLKVDESRDLEMQASARLISAAPDMYEALKLALAFLDHSESATGCKLDAFDLCEMALAKAEGRIS